MYRGMQYAGAALTAALMLACSSSETDPVSPPHNTTGARFSTVTPTATAWFYGASPLQEIKGWGVYPAGGSDPFHWAPSVQDALYRVGATIVREQLDPALYVSGSTVSNMVINTTLLNKYIAKIAYAKAHGVQSYILAIWSPPAIWKTNGSVNGSNNGHVGYLQSWAVKDLTAFVVKVMLALKASPIGLPVAFSVQNEPTNVVPYPGCLYTPAVWQGLMEEVRGSFDYWGLQNVTLLGPEASMYTPGIYYSYITHAPGYFGGLGYPSLGNASLNHAVGAYSFHLYGECMLQETQQAIALHPKDMWMTEWGRAAGSNELQWTIDMMSAMAAHLRILPQNYWFWWMGWTQNPGAPTNSVLLGGMYTPIYSKRYFALQKLWTTVRPGWHVNRLTTTDTQLQTGWGTQNACAARVQLIGFSSPDRGTAVVEIVNPTSTNKNIDVGGLPGTSYTSYRTDAWNDMVQQQSAGVWRGYATISAPANSVVIAIMK